MQLVRQRVELQRGRGGDPGRLSGGDRDVRDGPEDAAPSQVREELRAYEQRPGDDLDYAIMGASQSVADGMSLMIRAYGPRVG